MQRFKTVSGALSWASCGYNPEPIRSVADIKADLRALARIARDDSGRQPIHAFDFGEVVIVPLDSEDEQ